jgi:serine/threonine-protein kinase
MDREAFFRHLRQSRLLPEAALDEAARLTDSDRARAIARALVQRGLLTRYQAGRVLAGRPGRLLLGQYRVLDQLGRGAMGRVFKAVHTAMQRVVAVKVILPGLLEDPAAGDLFTREVRAAAQLHHPNIVTAYDANEIKGVRFLVMEYVEGPSLLRLVKALGPLPVALACELMRQAAAALQYAHERGVVHRDIKPGNLLIAHLPGLAGGEGQGGEAGRVAPPPSAAGYPPRGERAGAVPPSSGPVVKVVDFGLARVRDAGKGEDVDTIEVVPGVVLGTVDYISPEQAHDVHGVDIRSDLYSLGCTFYYGLAGRVPFPEGNALEKLLKQQTNEPAPLRSLRPDVPPAVEAIVRRLMAKDRERRFQTPGDLVQELVALSGLGGLRHLSSPVAVEVPADPPYAPLPEWAPDTDEPASGEPTAVQATSFPLPPPGSPDLPAGAALREKLREWTALVEYILCRRGAFRRVKREAFAALQQQLVGACQAQASAAVGDRRAFFLRLEELLKPWLSPEALTQTDLEVRSQILDMFHQAERELDRWLAADRASAVDDQTAVSRFLTRIKTTFGAKG